MLRFFTKKKVVDGVVDSQLDEFRMTMYRKENAKTCLTRLYTRRDDETIIRMSEEGKSLEEISKVVYQSKDSLHYRIQMVLRRVESLDKITYRRGPYIAFLSGWLRDRPKGKRFDIIN